MDIKQRLTEQYEHISIYSAGFYADPENNFENRNKLLDTLKSFVINQHASTPFCLQIMTTNGEINIMPLGLLDLTELRLYEKKLRRKRELALQSEGTPLLIQFIPHIEKTAINRQIIGTTEELFKNFDKQFIKIWHVVQQDLESNQLILESIEDKLLTDSQKIANTYQQQLEKTEPAERESKVGFKLAATEIGKFSYFMADMSEIQAIISSAADFCHQELLADNLFVQVINDSVRRSTFFWILDNTFYEIFYYFIQKYQKLIVDPKIVKHLHYKKSNLLTNMRTDAYKLTTDLVNHPDKKIDFNQLLSNIFMPLAKKIAADIDNFS